MAADGTIPPPEQYSGLSLDALAKLLGRASPAARRMAFRGADETWMLARGQETASELILDEGAAFVRSTLSIWALLSATQRASVLGYDPALDAVLVEELVELRARNAAYDRLARGSGSTVGERRQREKESFSAGVTLRQNVFQTLRDLLGAEHAAVVGLAGAMKRAATADVLANGLVALADTIHRARHGDEAHPPNAELVEDLDLAKLTDATETDLRQAAQDVLDTAELAAARPQDLAAAQRALDVQDGRVLHVIGLVVRAFRRARRADETMLVPALGDLARVFGGSGRAGSEDDPPAAPPSPPGPTPPPNG